MKRLLTAALISATLASAPSFVSAHEAPAAVAKADTVRQQSAEALKIAEQGFMAVRDVRMARVAIFQGAPEHAVKLTDAAAKLLADDSTDWKKFARSSKKAALVDDQYVVIDATMGISENYVGTPEKEAAIKKANEKLAAGDKKGAIDVLRLADVAVVQNLYLMPLKQSQKAVAEAQTLLSQKKYYEANLVLKSIEDSIVVDGAAVVAN
ncbi:YfdX family protein [Pantoea sp. 1.19]|uniref:YfdX family protein n=1 Tax=Pantoea sp. 1.19 TaxID=1925589 RepID=UPI000948D2B3|nr:YfdX family protein [Pantoea sp. 1.19]